MAQSNKRYFNTFFYEDPYIEGLDSECRWVYITMILNPHNNLAGCYELSVQKLANYTALPIERVRAAIQQLQEDRKILFSGSWLALKNFIKNNEFNPNMCKNSFDIMKSAPKDKIVFILSDIAGNAEPWISDFISKVERGINQSIDSKNRNAIKKAKESGLPAPPLVPHQTLTIEQFASQVLDRQVESIRGTLPPTVPKALGEPWPEYKGEEEYKEEYKFKTEEEEGNHAVNPQPPTNWDDDEPAIQPIPPQIKPAQDPIQESAGQLITEIINHWNSKTNLPRCRYQSITIPGQSDFLGKLSVFTPSEIIQSIDNLSNLWDKIEPKYRPRTLSKFILKVDEWTDEARPGERYKKTKEKKDQIITDFEPTEEVNQIWKR
jgi:hypothetical protein